MVISDQLEARVTLLVLTNIPTLRSGYSNLLRPNLTQNKVAPEL